MKVRPATGVDVQALQGVARAAYLPYVEQIGVRPGPLDTDYAAAVAEGDTWVAEQGGEIVALLILRVHDAYVLVENIAVVPQAQGMGVGSRLLGLADDRAHREGKGEVQLFTHERMTRNLAFYRRRGFRERRRERDGELARVFMSKTL